MRHHLVRAPAIIVLALLLASTAAPVQATVDVTAFEDIQASPVVITPDPGGRAAILEVETTIDVACSVIYGTDDSFGLIAVDQDMDGGAHTDHQPVMGGLRPDTLYRYRLQGTAPDGTIYVSEVMSFVTPAVAADAPRNLAPDAEVSGVSSEWSDAFMAGNAFDGDISTAWSSRGDGDEAWIEIDLGAPRPLAGVEFRTRSMSDGTATTETFTLVADGSAYGPFPADTPIELEDLSAQVLRFEVETSTGGNTGAVEIVVLEKG